MIEFQCPECAHPMRVADKAAGKTGTCKSCGHKLKVPAPTKLAVPDPVLVTTQPHHANPYPPIVDSAPAVAVQVNVPQPSRAAHSLGIGAVILGIVAVLICWIPVVNVIALPLAGIGILMALIGGLAALTRRGRGLGEARSAGWPFVSWWP